LNKCPQKKYLKKKKKCRTFRKIHRTLFLKLCPLEIALPTGNSSAHIITAAVLSGNNRGDDNNSAHIITAAVPSGNNRGDDQVNAFMSQVLLVLVVDGHVVLCIH
jgi:hypothetical protein